MPPGERQFAIEELKAAFGSGLLAFPATDFDADDTFDAAAFASRVDFLADHGCGGMFVAGGAGEFFSLTFEEFERVVAVSVERRRPGIPVIAAAGYGTRTAIAYAEAAERLGADGILLFPPYLTETTQEGMLEHVAAVCAATSIGVVVYSRANGIIEPATLETLAARCPNLVGYKDGVGDPLRLMEAQARVGDRLVFINGMPTAELHALPFRAMGITAYSSALFNFMPVTARAFHEKLEAGDRAGCLAFIESFVVPYSRIRAARPGYAVAIVKAGLRIVGRSAGPVRPPISDLSPAEEEALAALIRTLGPDP